jgi:hypothetical protein
MNLDDSQWLPTLAHRSTPIFAAQATEPSLQTSVVFSAHKVDQNKSFMKLSY